MNLWPVEHFFPHFGVPNSQYDEPDLNKSQKSRQKTPTASKVIKFGYSEKATKFEKIFHLKFDATQ